MEPMYAKAPSAAWIRSWLVSLMVVPKKRVLVRVDGEHGVADLQLLGFIAPPILQADDAERQALREGLLMTVQWSVHVAWTPVEEFFPPALK